MMILSPAGAASYISFNLVRRAGSGVEVSLGWSTIAFEIV